MAELAVSFPAPELPSCVAALVDRFAPHDCPVVITGPIGVGKTHLARIIHERSGRAGSFVPVPLTSLQPGFEHVTLAGHDKGAYTGAHQGRGGLLAEANRGTLFLDEIGDASVEGQRLLLELLTERGLRRLGEERRLRFDLRFILATHIDLDSATAAGRFREDLLSRLGNCWIHLAPLRERPEEITPLVAYYLAQFARQNDQTPPRLSGELWATLAAAPWLYNVRSLMSECQSLATAAPRSGDLTIGHLSDRFWREIQSYVQTLPDDRTRLAYVTGVVGDRRGRAAPLLGLSERSFQRRAAEAGLARIPGRPRRAAMPIAPSGNPTELILADGMADYAI